MAKMTERQKRFCDEYLISLNATQAAIKAGYSKKYANTNANKLLQNTTISEFIAERMAEKEKDLIADQDEVLKYLTSVLRGETESEIVVVEGTGMGESSARKVQKAPDEKERLKAAELLGKRYGIFKDKVQNEIVLPVFGGEERLED
jgi:phage terminase small subunit